MVIWKAQRTLLIVGEGYHEVAFLNHLKQMLSPRGSGLRITIKNARGKGALHVIEWTGRQIANSDYDQVAALLDTDKDWTPTTIKKAKQRRIQILKSEPCLEAMLLRVLGQASVGDSKALKKQFAPFVNNDATQRDNYAENFGRDVLLAARIHEPTVDALLRLFDV